MKPCLLEVSNGLGSCFDTRLKAATCLKRGLPIVIINIESTNIGISCILYQPLRRERPLLLLARNVGISSSLIS